MRKFVVTRHQFMGVHHWPDAPEEVSFLRNLHAHIFYVTVKVEVRHADRDVEFFILRKALIKACNHVAGMLKNDPSQSCEMMAADIGATLMLRYKVIEVTVSEDGQQDGIASWEDEGQIANALV